MANSFVRYTGNGTTTAYAIPFSYRSVDDLSATVNGVVVTAYTLDGAGTTLTFTTAPAASSAIEIRRTTSQTTKLVDYVSGSVLTESDLDTDSDQAFYMAQEAIDKAGDVITLDNADFQWDVQSKRLKNVAAPTADTDAVNKAFISTNIPNITTVAGISSDVTTVAGISSDVTAVAADATDIGIVSTNIASVNTVATNIADVIKVADDLNEAISEVETVANDLNEATSEIETVANSITNVDTVGTNIANVNTVAGISGNVTTVAGISSDVTGVAGISTAVTNVNSNSTNINAVNANSANINTVAGINSDVTTVAGISGNVTTVATNDSNITAVAGNATNINAVASNATNINAVNANSTNINTVAGANANVTTVAGSIANVNTVGSNIGTVNNFADRYRVQAGEPSVNNDEGDLIYDTTANAVKVYNGTSFDTIQQGITDVAPTRHSIRPSLNLDFANSKVLDPRITFTRASNATYYDGYTSVKAEENLIKDSETFTTSWSNVGNTITGSSAIAPDGTNTAVTIADDNTTARHGPYNTYIIKNSSSNYTLSCYLKKNSGTDYAQIHFNGGNSWVAVLVNLANGTVEEALAGSSANLVGSGIEDVGNGWYRAYVTGNYVNTTAHVKILISDTASPTRDAFGNVTYIGASNRSIYAWGAQFEQRDSLTAYTPTTSSPITQYQPALQTAGNNVARFDHNPTTGESLGLLIEESRTNTQTYSEEFDNAAWNKSGTTITANTIIAPDGKLTADKLVEDTNTGTHLVNDINSLGGSVDNTNYVCSVYAKAGERTNIKLIENGTNTANDVVFDLSNGTIVSGSNGTITDVGNGWYRCSILATIDVTTSYNFHTRLHNGSTDNYTGDGYSGVYLWGAQVERGSFPTSYIKTTGSQVTRSADDAEILNIDTSDWFNNQEGTLYTNLNINTLSNTNVAGVSLGDNNNLSDNRIEMRAVGTSTSIPRFDMTTNGVSQLLIQAPNLGSETNRRLSLSYSMNDYNVSTTANGNSVTSDTDGNIPILNKLVIGKAPYNNLQQLGGTIKKVSYYPIALTDNEIIDLTEE